MFAVQNSGKIFRIFRENGRVGAQLSQFDEVKCRFSDILSLIPVSKRKRDSKIYAAASVEDVSCGIQRVYVFCYNRSSCTFTLGHIEPEETDYVVDHEFELHDSNTIIDCRLVDGPTILILTRSKLYVVYPLFDDLQNGEFCIDNVDLGASDPSNKERLSTSSRILHTTVLPCGESVYVMVGGDICGEWTVPLNDQPTGGRGLALAKKHLLPKILLAKALCADIIFPIPVTTIFNQTSSSGSIDHQSVIYAASSDSLTKLIKGRVCARVDVPHAPAHIFTVTNCGALTEHTNFGDRFVDNHRVIVLFEKQSRLQMFSSNLRLIADFPNVYTAIAGDLLRNGQAQLLLVRCLELDNPRRSTWSSRRWLDGAILLDMNGKMIDGESGESSKKSETFDSTNSIASSLSERYSAGSARVAQLRHKITAKRTLVDRTVRRLSTRNEVRCPLQPISIKATFDMSTERWTISCQFCVPFSSRRYSATLLLLVDNVQISTESQIVREKSKFSEELSNESSTFADVSATLDTHNLQLSFCQSGCWSLEVVLRVVNTDVRKDSQDDLSELYNIGILQLPRFPTSAMAHSSVNSSSSSFSIEIPLADHDPGHELSCISGTREYSVALTIEENCERIDSFLSDELKMSEKLSTGCTQARMFSGECPQLNSEFSVSTSSLSPNSCVVQVSSSSRQSVVFTSCRLIEGFKELGLTVTLSWMNAENLDNFNDFTVSFLDEISQNVSKLTEFRESFERMKSSFQSASRLRKRSRFFGQQDGIETSDLIRLKKDLQHSSGISDYLRECSVITDGCAETTNNFTPMNPAKLACCLFGALALIVTLYFYEHSKSTSGSENNVSQQLHHIPKSQLANLIPGNVSHTSPNASDQNVTNNQPEGVSQRAQKPMLDDIFGFALVPYDKLLLKRKQSVIDLVNEKIPNQAESHSSYVGKTATGKQHVYAFLVPSSGNHSTSNQMQTPA
eukprot:912557_1